MGKANAKAVKVKLPEKFTFNAMIAYVAAKSELSKRQVKGIIDDYLSVVHAGVVSGARVPLGAIGKLFVKVRPASKARKGRNPLTGEEITIKAKPATKVPKCSFSKSFKEAAKKAKI